MGLFRRRKVEDSVELPAEVQDYYQTANRQRTAWSWALAIGTLLITVALILGLFYGGRWLYRKTRNQSKPATVGVQEAVPTPETSTSSTTGSTSSSSNTSSTTSTTPSTTSTTTTPSTSTTSSPSSTTTTTTSPTSTSTPTSTTPSTSTTNSSTTVASSTGLPNTGPSDTLAIFAAVSVFGYFAHRRFAKG